MKKDQRKCHLCDSVQKDKHCTNNSCAEYQHPLITKKKLLEFMKDEAIPFDFDNNEDATYAFYSITEEFEFLFLVENRGDSNGSHWLQIEYYSDKIGHTIIWDYDYQSHYENAEELVDKLLETKKEIEDFEDKLPAITETDPNNADHPARKKAIQIIEKVLEPTFKPKGINGKQYYELEDQLTNIIK